MPASVAAQTEILVLAVYTCDLSGGAPVHLNVMPLEASTRTFCLVLRNGASVTAGWPSAAAPFLAGLPDWSSAASRALRLAIWMRLNVKLPKKLRKSRGLKVEF